MDNEELNEAAGLRSSVWGPGHHGATSPQGLCHYHLKKIKERTSILRSIFLAVKLQFNLFIYLFFFDGGDTYLQSQNPGGRDR